MTTTALDRARPQPQRPARMPRPAPDRIQDGAVRFPRRAPDASQQAPAQERSRPRPGGVMRDVLRALGVASSTPDTQPTPSARLALKAGISPLTRWGSQPGSPPDKALRERLAGQDLAIAAHAQQQPPLQKHIQDVRELVQLGQAQAMRYLQLQARLQRGTFSALSNLLKARFDALRRITQGFRD